MNAKKSGCIIIRQTSLRLHRWASPTPDLGHFQTWEVNSAFIMFHAIITFNEYLIISFNRFLFSMPNKINTSTIFLKGKFCTYVWAQGRNSQAKSETFFTSPGLLSNRVVPQRGARWKYYTLAQRSWLFLPQPWIRKGVGDAPKYQSCSFCVTQLRL